MAIEIMISVSIIKIDFQLLEHIGIKYCTYVEYIVNKDLVVVMMFNEYLSTDSNLLLICLETAYCILYNTNTTASFFSKRANYGTQNT